MEVKHGFNIFVILFGVSGRFTLFGIKIDAEVEGKAGGADAKAGRGRII